MRGSSTSEKKRPAIASCLQRSASSIQRASTLDLVESSATARVPLEEIVANVPQTLRERSKRARYVHETMVQDLMEYETGPGRLALQQTVAEIPGFNAFEKNLTPTPSPFGRAFKLQCGSWPCREDELRRGEMSEQARRTSICNGITLGRRTQDRASRSRNRARQTRKWYSSVWNSGYVSARIPQGMQGDARRNFRNKVLAYLKNQLIIPLDASSCDYFKQRLVEKAHRAVTKVLFLNLSPTSRCTVGACTCQLVTTSRGSWAVLQGAETNFLNFGVLIQPVSSP